MKRTLLFLFILSFSQVFAQPAIQWQHTIGGDSIEYVWSVQQTRDAGYIIGGYSKSNIYGNKTENNIGLFDYWIVKTDSMGVVQWDNTIGGTDEDLLRVIQQTSDGGYIIGGTSSSDSSGDKSEHLRGLNDYWVVKVDSMGVIQWENTIQGNQDDRLWAVSQTSDGGYILGGQSNSNATLDKTEGTNGQIDYWLVKLDANGNIQWQNDIGGSNIDVLNAVKQTSDGGYILGGSSRSNANGDKTEGNIGQDDYWIIKVNSTGSIVWQNVVGGNDYDEVTCIQQTLDGGYIVGGYSISDISGDKTQNSRGWYDYWVVKLNSSGVVQWDKTYGGDSTDYLYSIQQTLDTGYILCGYSVSGANGDKTEARIGGEDIWIIKTDPNGNIKWQNTIGGNLNDEARSIQQTTDQGYIIGGNSISNIGGDKTENSIGFVDYWLVKINHELWASATHVSDVLCHGDSSGIGVAIPSGGAPPYTYQWIPSGGSNATASLAAGTYSCHVTDAGGGTTYTNAITITEPPLLSSAITAHTDPLCHGGTGSAVVVASGGVGSFSYQWNSTPVQTTDTAINLLAGTYTATVFDGNGCTATDVVTITEPPVLWVSVVAWTNLVCYGGNNGDAKAVAGGGTGALTYSWNTTPPQNQPTANALSAGTYTVTVTDANGCTATSTVTITQPPLLVSIISSQTDVSPCAGGSNGSAIVTAGGGTGAYTYAWSTIPAQYTATATNLSAGNYTVTVTDANHCFNSIAAIITEPPHLDPGFVITSTVCGNNTGSVTANISNGTAPYTYLWNTGSTTNAVTGLTGSPADTLTLIMSDANHCVDTSSYILTCLQCSLQVAASTPVDSCPLTSITLSVAAVTTVQSCALNMPTGIAPDGAACTNPDDTLGCPSSNYVYASLTSPSCLDSLISCGTIESVYISLDSISGTPSHGCGNDNVLWLRSPAGTLWQLVAQRPLNSNADNHYKPTFTSSGSLGAIPNVGNISYNGVGYMPDGGSLCSAFTGESLYASNAYATALGLGAGTWIAYMNDMDNAGCTNVARITEFCIVFHNPSAGLSYAWSSSGGCNLLLSDTTIANPQFNIPSGSYDCTFTVTVSDSCGCSGTDSVRIHCNSPLTSEHFNAQSNFSIQPNPAHNSFTVSFSGQLTVDSGQLDIYDLMGRAVYDAPIVNRKSYVVNTELPAGIYFVKVTEAGHVHTQKLVIE